MIRLQTSVQNPILPLRLNRLLRALHIGYVHPLSKPPFLSWDKLLELRFPAHSRVHHTDELVTEGFIVQEHDRVMEPLIEVFFDALDRLERLQKLAVADQHHQHRLLARLARGNGKFLTGCVEGCVELVVGLLDGPALDVEEDFEDGGCQEEKQRESCATAERDAW